MSTDIPPLNPDPSLNAKPIDAPSPDEIWGMSLNTYCMLLHLSQLLNCCVPPFGWITPIVLWAANKDQHPRVDTQGKLALNWLISELIYICALSVAIVIAVLLTMVLIGYLFLVVLIPVSLALMIVGIVFPIIAAIKANEGTVWIYPLSIPFFKVDVPMAGSMPNSPPFDATSDAPETVDAAATFNPKSEK